VCKQKSSRAGTSPSPSLLSVPRRGDTKPSLFRRYSRLFFISISVATLSFLTLNIGVASSTDVAIRSLADESSDVVGLQHCPDGCHGGNMAVPPAAIAKCPEGCTCKTPEEAKKLGYQLCQGKQIVCGYDQFKKPMYCYAKPPALPPPVTCPKGCTCMTPAEAQKIGYPLCQGKQTICGYDQYQKPMYCFTKTTVTCLKDCACMTQQKAKEQGYSLLCEGKQTLCDHDDYGTPMYCWTKPLPPPDLLIQGVRLRPLGDGEFKIEYTIVNWGRGDAPASVTGLYVDGDLVAEDAVSRLLSAEERDEVFRWHYDMASCTPPRDAIRVVADYRDEFDESYEDNNEGSLDWECPEVPLPDLHFRRVWTESLGAGEHRIAYEIENLGPGAATRFSQTAIYVDDVMEAEVRVGPLEPGERREFSFTYDLASCTGSADTIRLVADSERAVEETNERNNEESLTWECPERPKPDLVIHNVWWEHEPGSLQNLYIRYSIENRSLASTGPSVTRLWINGERIANSSVPELDGGEVLPMVTFTERWTPQVNDNRVRICADANGNVDESSSGELNNCLEVDWTFELSCCDRFQSRDEEGIDCGGSHCPPCNRCDLSTLPSRFDWRDYYALSLIRDQSFPQSCGSCWAHAAVGAIEGTYIVENCGGTLDISEQNAICECPGGCDEGCPHDVLRRARDHGIVDENCQPYLASNSPCTKCGDWRDKLWRINEYHRVSSDIEDIKKAIICYGPLSVGSENWRHAVVIIGYDDSLSYDGRTGCWIIRNSWDTDWSSGGQAPGYGLIPYSGHDYSDIKNYVHYVRGVQSP